LFVDYAEMDLRDLKEVLTNHPTLNVVMQNMSWSFQTKIVPYLKKFPNFHIELSNMQANRAVETLVEVVGAKQILFGSGLPKMSVGAARAFIDYAMISDEDKQLIAGGNAAMRTSAREFREEIIKVRGSIAAFLEKNNRPGAEKALERAYKEAWKKQHEKTSSSGGPHS
jgi:hypothetical protein